MGRRALKRCGGSPDTTSSLGKALEGFLAESGLKSALDHPKLCAIWEKMVGPEMARHTRILSFRRGVLEVGVDSSSLMSEMQFLRHGLLHDLRQALSKPFVSSISFVVTPGPAGDGPADVEAP